MFSTDLLSPAPAISDCFSILKEQPSFSEGAVMASDVNISKKMLLHTIFSYSLSELVKMLPWFPLVS